MTGLRFPLDPRMIPPEKVARRIGVSPAVFAEKRAELERDGFPKPYSVLGNYSLDAVDRWIDKQAGITPAGQAITDPATLMERARSRPWRK